MTTPTAGYNSDSTANDSLYQLNLRLFINDYQYLEQAYESALKEITLSDSALTVQAGTIIDLVEGERKGFY